MNDPRPRYALVRARADTASLIEVERLFTNASSSAKHPDRLRWQYSTPPAGPGYFTLARDVARPPRLAAMYAAFPVHMKVGHDLATCVQSLDTLTHPDFRGRGLFPHLANDSYTWLDADGVAGVYGFPNDSSGPGFFNKLSWTRLGTAPFLVRPLGTRYLRSRLGLRSASDHSLHPAEDPETEGVERVTTCPSDLNDVWERFSNGFEVGLVRDAAYIRWRIFEKPLAPYHSFTLRDRSSGALRGFASCSVERKHGGTIAYVLEVMTDGRNPGDHRTLLRHLTRFAVHRGADIMLAWSFSHSTGHGSYRRAGFAPLPERLRPIHLHLGVRAFDGAPSALSGPADNWYVSYLDSDTV